MRDSCVPVLAVWRAGLQARVPVFAKPHVRGRGAVSGQLCEDVSTGKMEWLEGKSRNGGVDEK